MIICICRGKSERDIAGAIDRGATTVRDLQRCGIGDQCGSCHTTLKGMLARAAAERAAAADCPACTTPVNAPAPLSAMA